MKIIKQLCNEISGNIDEAREKIRMAYELKCECPEAANWYRDMANSHINFNTNGHATIKKVIEAYKASDAYKREPEYANGMIAAFEAVHNDLIVKSAEVKSLIDGWK